MSFQLVAICSPPQGHVYYDTLDLGPACLRLADFERLMWAMKLDRSAPHASGGRTGGGIAPLGSCAVLWPRLPSTDDAPPCCWHSGLVPAGRARLVRFRARRARANGADFGGLCRRQ